MAATQCTLAYRHVQGNLLNSEHQGRINSSGFECGMVASRILKLLIRQDFDELSLVFTENDLKKIKYPVKSSCLGENALMMPEVRGEWCLQECLPTIGQKISCWPQFSDILFEDIKSKHKA